MLDFITNLLPRLRQFSQSLDYTELFADKPWVLLDEDGQQQTSIFQRGGKLIMSLDGKVQMGTWEYIAAAQSLLIDRGADQLLLNHFFFTEALLVLARDGRAESKFVLANKLLIPDLDIGKHLRELEVRQAIQLKNPAALVAPRRLNQLSIKTTDGIELLFYCLGKFVSKGDSVHLNEAPAPNGRYVTERIWGMDVKDGFIQSIFWPKKYQLKTGGEVTVDCVQKEIGPTINDQIFSSDEFLRSKNGRPLEDGKYNLVGEGKVRVVKGRIDSFPLF